jgi:hypothetical protein
VNSKTTQGTEDQDTRKTLTTIDGLDSSLNDTAQSTENKGHLGGRVDDGKVVCVSHTSDDDETLAERWVRKANKSRRFNN